MAGVEHGPGFEQEPTQGKGKDKAKNLPQAPRVRPMDEAPRGTILMVVFCDIHGTIEP
jgi:hypothetical protein